MKPPAWCDSKELREHWEKPWLVPLSKFKARKFKRRLWEHGYLSPHLTRKECASKDGAPIPRSLRTAAQRQAFHIERVRHIEGDKPVTFLSWYRSPAHNAAVGGASASQHLKARATDQPRFGGESARKAVLETVFAQGGIGTSQSTGEILHVDSRRGPARWFYA